MLHCNRVWCVNQVASAEELARKLKETTWCGCHAFSLGDYLWLNDSTSPDGAQEYAVVKQDGGNGASVQLESITFSWCDEATSLQYIRDTLDDRDDHHSFRRSVAPVLQTPEEHGHCALCR
jgi:hypothetical protein